MLHHITSRPISSRISRLTGIIAILTFLVGIQPTSIRAQEVENPDSKNERSDESPSRLPILNGFQFTSPVAFPAAFIGTRVGLSTGGGIVEDLEFRLELDEGIELTTLSGDIAFIASGFEYHQAVSDVIQINGGLNILTRIATHEQSLLSQGITTIVGYSIGVRGKIWSNQQFYISAAGTISRNNLIGITPLQFLEKIIDEGFDPDGDNDLLRSEISSRLIGGLDLAYSPSPYLGIMIHSEFGASNPFEDDTRKIPVSSFAVVIQTDLGLFTKIPLGVYTGLLTNSLSPAANDFAKRTTTFILGLTHTANRNVDVGLELASSRLDQVISGDSFTASVVRLFLTHHF